jgi:hypothetical protein
MVDRSRSAGHQYMDAAASTRSVRRSAGGADTRRIVNASARPPDQLPPLDRLQRLLLPVADGFMVVMLSRPPTGTLRTTRVTRASIALAVATLAISGTLAAALVVAVGRLGPLALAAVAPLSALAAGAAALALYGLRQHR